MSKSGKKKQMLVRPTIFQRRISTTESQEN